MMKVFRYRLWKSTGSQGTDTESASNEWVCKESGTIMNYWLSNTSLVVMV